MNTHGLTLGAVMLAAVSSFAGGEGATFGYWQQPLKITGDSAETAKRKAQQAARAEQRRKARAADPEAFDYRELAWSHKMPPDEARRRYEEFEAKGKGRAVRSAFIFGYAGRDAAITCDAIETELKVPRTGFNGLHLAKARFAGGEDAKALAALAPVLTNTVLKVAVRAEAKVFAAYLGDFPGDSRAYCDALGTNGEPKAEADLRYLRAIREVQKTVFAVKSDPSTMKRLERLAKAQRELLHDEARVRYEVRFLQDAPRTAEGAYLSDVFAKLPKENRFGVYNAYVPWYPESVDKRRKSLPPPNVAADAKGYEGWFASACDATGLHLYVKVGDPKAADTLAGLADGADFEFDLQPGENCAPHWQWGSVRKPNQYWGVEWDTPHPGYKLTGDTIAVDAFTANDCHVFHIFAPWRMCYSQLPRSGTEWRLVLLAGASGHLGSLGSGAAHELGRGACLKFALKPEDAEAIKTGTLKSLIGEYRAARGLWENAGFWRDPHLGDVEFYDAVVKPTCDELDGEASRLTASMPSGAALDETFARCAFAFGDFKLYIDQLRERWLLERAFK